MKAVLIHINWMFSFFGLTIDTEKAPLLAILFVIAYFVGSSLLLMYYDEKGKMHSAFSVKLMRWYLRLAKKTLQ